MESRSWTPFLPLGLLAGLTVLLAACTVYQTDGPDQQKSDQVYICHRGETLRLPDDAIRTHLNHGDSLGVCEPAGGPAEKQSGV